MSDLNDYLKKLQSVGSVAWPAALVIIVYMVLSFLKEQPWTKKD